jgi:hypothetical protein
MAFLMMQESRCGDVQGRRKCLLAVREADPPPSAKDDKDWQAKDDKDWQAKDDRDCQAKDDRDCRV